MSNSKYDKIGNIFDEIQYVAIGEKYQQQNQVINEQLNANTVNTNNSAIKEEAPKQIDEVFTFDENDNKQVIEEKPVYEQTPKQTKGKIKKKAIQKKKPKIAKNNDEKGKKSLHFYCKILVLVDICALFCFFTVYGPISVFRDWLVTTAMNTTSHRYFAYTFYSKNYVNRICSSFVTVQSEKNTDTSAIVFVDHSNDTTYSSIYEEQVLKKDANNDLYKIIKISEDGYVGFITVIYEPKRLELVIAQGSTGQLISSFASQYGALVAINAGPAKWYYEGVKTLRPYNNIIADGQIVNSDGLVGEIIGINYDGVLCLLTCTAEEAIKQNLNWGVQFGPNLVVNGVETVFTKDGGYGTHPRTAIGQRKDGIVLLFTIDGRGGNGSKGISMPKLADLAVRYGCYNAANLDGGGSTTLVVEQKLVNEPVSYQFEGERKLYNAVIFR